MTESTLTINEFVNQYRGEAIKLLPCTTVVHAEPPLMGEYPDCDIISTYHPHLRNTKLMELKSAVPPEFKIKHLNHHNAKILANINTSSFRRKITEESIGVTS